MRWNSRPLKSTLSAIDNAAKQARNITPKTTPDPTASQLLLVSLHKDDNGNAEARDNAISPTSVPNSVTSVAAPSPNSAV
jgi:hypothetical protein